MLFQKYFPSFYELKSYQWGKYFHLLRILLHQEQEKLLTFQLQCFYV